MRLDIDTRDLDRFREDLARLTREVPGEMLRVAGSAVEEMESAVTDSTRGEVRQGTGELLAGISSETRVTGTGVQGIVKNTARHAHLVEYGTGGRRQKTTGRYTGRMPQFAPMRKAADTRWPGLAGSAERELARLVESLVIR